MSSTERPDFDDGVYGITEPDFAPVEEYTTFRAEWAVIQDDIVVHFFVNDEIKKRGDSSYWLRTFPEHLDRVAKEVFKVEPPQIEAAFTPELASWWFRARGFGAKLSPEGLAQRLFERLDQSLDATNSM